MADDHVQPLLDDDQPSWVTVANDKKGKNKGGTDASSVGSSPWDQAAARLSAVRPDTSNSWASSSAPPIGVDAEKENDLPKVVLMMRLGNLGAAALLIFGSVSALRRYSLHVLLLL
mmetsp:Transcript_20460/g.43892  ORF Transcript_20460/g.43892 Transcript_20460/m.43892 type:complete len:116 (-) Transcript_20460:878-1225(-)